MNRKVKSLMVLKGIKSIDIARQLGVSRVTVSIVLTGKGKSQRIQKAIADALCMQYEKLWSNSSNGSSNSNRSNKIFSNVG